ncbi:MAG: NifB/NifX family molybdenum-iron cluster-binding protein [Candidatus Aenigmatarchaeota archaeon]
MRLLFPSKGLGHLDDQIARAFGAADIFVIAEVEEGKVKRKEVYPNTVQDIDPGFEEETAMKAVSDRKVDAVIARDISDTDRKVLEMAGVTVVAGYNMTIRQAIKKYLESVK